MNRALKNLSRSLVLSALVSSFGAAETKVALSHHVPQETAKATKLGPVRADEMVHLGLVVRLDEALLKQTMDELYGPQASAHKHFLSSSEFAQKFGLAAKREKLKNFAQAQGLTVDSAAEAPGSMIVKVSARAALVENAFSLKLNHYRTRDGRDFRSHETEPMVPASLTPHLASVVGLSNLTGVMHPYLHASPISRSPAAKPGASSNASAHPSFSGGTGSGGTLAPADIKTIYSLNSVSLTGSGQKVAVFELDGYNPADISAYTSAFNLPALPVTFVGVDGTTNLCAGQSCSTQNPSYDQNMIEVALDIQMVAALAPGVSQVLVYDNANSWQGALDNYNQIAVDDMANVVSTSWGAPESAAGDAFIQSESQVFQRMAIQGQSIYAASGDSGAYADGVDLSVQDPSSQPYVTGVGGTTLSGSVQSYTETVWSGSGGGVSQYWPIPNYQAGTPTLASQQYRNVPDVALNSDPNPGYAVYVGGSWWQVGGTSLAAPLWAALTALVNQERLTNGKGVFGFANPNLYLLGANNANQGAFHDITSGSNGYYVAGAGYDNATGWGSYVGSAMVGAGSQSFPTVVISTPAAGQGLASVVSIYGTATSGAFASYKVEYAANVSSPTFQLIGTVHTSPVTNGLLETWNTAALAAGSYSLRLTLTDTSNTSYSATASPLFIDHAPPTVAFSTPTEGAVFTSGQSFSVQATASDDAGVQSVTFLDNGGLIAQVLNPPYAAYATLVGTGTHTLSAVARDFVGHTATATVHITLTGDTTPPTPPTTVAVYPYSATLLEPYWYGATDNVAVTGYRMDASTDPLFGTFLLGYQNIDVGNTTVALISGLTPLTTYYVRIRAYDAAGNVSTNSLTAQGVTPPSPPPYISITNPLSGATAFGREEIDVYTYSQASSLQRVDYLVDGQAPVSISSYPYTYYWDTTVVANGSHQLSAIAYDVTGASASVSIPLTVTNLSIFQDNFNSGSFSSWTVVDDGNISAPSHWQVVSGALNQTSPIHGSDATLRLGTQVVAGGPSWTDYSLSLHMTPTNGDAGVIFRRQDNNNYYRFSMSSDGFFYLAEIIGGTVGFLNNYPISYVPGQSYAVTIDVKGYMLRVFVNGQIVAVTNNSSFLSGGIGLYTYNATNTVFDDVQVLGSAVPDSVPPTVTLVSPTNGSILSGLVTMSGTASDNVGVAKVNILGDGLILGMASGTTSWTYLLDTSLVGNGSHVLSAQAVDFAGNPSNASIQVTINNPGQASYDPTFKAPLCSTVGALCDSSSLLNGRDSLPTGAEPHQPNTIYNSCADGPNGTYHSDESNDRIQITTVDGQPFAPGKSVKVQATVWAYVGYTADALDLYYTATASSPTWTYLTTIVPSAPGAQVLSATYTLPAGNLQAVRANFRFGGSPMSCTTGAYDDHDDLVFAVGSSSAGSSAFFVKTDTGTQGTWKGAYGGDGFSIHADSQSLPGYAQLGITGNGDYTWVNSTTDNRALQKAASADRLASCWVSGSSFTLDVNLTDGATHQVALYVLDWDSYGGGRLEQMSVTDAGTGTLLDSRTAASFQNGQYYVWNIKGHVKIAFTNLNSNAVLSGIFFGAGAVPPPPGSSAFFVKTDTGTQGTWKGTYGTDGFGLEADTINYPAYAQINITNSATYTWSSSTTNVRALQKASASDRVAACWYSQTTFSLDVNLTDGATHQVALYVLDWDNYGGGRLERMDVTDAATGALLDSRTASSFQNGQYYVWTIKGHVKVTLTNLNSNAVVSGIFFDTGAPPPPPPGSSAFFVKTDTGTEGTWKGAYGGDGFSIHADSQSLPGYAQLGIAGSGDYTWTTTSSDNRALQEESAGARIASCWVSGSTFTLDVNLTDGATHQVALYVLDWDGYGGGRLERLTVTDAATGTLLDSRTASSFQNGQYYVWTIKGHVKVTLTNLNSNAVLSGIFFGTGATLPPPSGGSAFFVKTDTGTEGTWKGAYGADGFSIHADSQSVPGYAQLGITGNGDYTWVNSTTDNRALQKAAAADRLASCWVSGSSFTLDVNLTDGATHQVALYVLDWDSYGGGRLERISVTDAATGTLLDSRTAASFQNGQYYVWNIKGHVKIAFTNLNSNAVLSGIFFGAASNPNASADLPAPTFTPPTQIPVNGTLEAGYSAAYSITAFDWTLSSRQPMIGVGQNANAMSIPNVLSAGLAASLGDVASHANLAKLNLPPGQYRISVIAKLQDGRASPAASADISLVQPVTSSVRVRPNPFRADRGDQDIIFDQLPAGSTVKIFTVSGRWVDTLSASGTSVTWLLTNASGDKVASGLYLYLITDDQGTKTHGKFAVIR